MILLGIYLKSNVLFLAGVELIQRDIQFAGSEAIFTSTLLRVFQQLICGFVIGALISHEKLLLQINTEREIGDMDYKLGQVC